MQLILNGLFLMTLELYCTICYFYCSCDKSIGTLQLPKIQFICAGSSNILNRIFDEHRCTQESEVNCGESKTNVCVPKEEEKT